MSKSKSVFNKINTSQTVEISIKIEFGTTIWPILKKNLSNVFATEARDNDLGRSCVDLIYGLCFFLLSSISCISHKKHLVEQNAYL